MIVELHFLSTCYMTGAIGRLWSRVLSRLHKQILHLTYGAFRRSHNNRLRFDQCKVLLQLCARFWKNKWYLIWTGCLFSLRWGKKKIQIGRHKKNSFSSSTNSQYFFMKISWIGPWVCRINWCKGHWFGLTYMVVRLSDISSKTT